MPRKHDDLQTLIIRNISRNHHHILSSIPSSLTRQARNNLARVIQNRVRSTQTNKRKFYGTPSHMTKAAMIRHIINHKFTPLNRLDTRDIRHNIGVGRLGMPIQRIYGSDSPQQLSPKTRSNEQKEQFKQKLERYPKLAIEAIYNTTFRDLIKNQNHHYLGGKTRKKLRF